MGQRKKEEEKKECCNNKQQDETRKGDHLQLRTLSSKPVVTVMKEKTRQNPYFSEKYQRTRTRTNEHRNSDERRKEGKEDASSEVGTEALTTLSFHETLIFRMSPSLSLVQKAVEL